MSESMLRLPHAPLRHRCCRVLLAAMLALLLPSHSQAAESEGKYRVEISGVSSSLESLLNEHLEIRRHRNDPQIDPEELRRLVDITPQQIRELLATEGYFSPRVEANLSSSDPPVASFRIEPGEPTRVESVEIRIIGEIADGPQSDPQRIERLRSQWSLKRGERFRQEEWTSAKNGLLKNLLTRDFAAAKITFSEARIDPRNRTAMLKVEVDSGPAFTFGDLEVQGLRRYSRDSVDQLNPIKPGERYSQDKLNDLQSRLQDSGYFRSAFASVDIDPARPKNVPVHLELVESERKRLGLGIGFSTDAGARFQIRWTDRQFLERNWRLESGFLFDRETIRLYDTVQLPALGNGWVPSFDGRFKREDVSGELTDTIRVGGRITSPNKRDEQVWGVYYLIDRQVVGDAFTNNRQALIASYIYTRRRLDNPISPRRGYVAAVEVDAGPQGVINNSNIIRVVGHATWLSSIRSNWQAVLRGQVGEVFQASRTDVPGDLLFRTGGDQTVRGYGYNSIGVPDSGAIVGGTVLAVMSAELVYWLRPEWGAAMFADAGDATESWSQMSPKRGFGVGARWRSPIGPVNLDVAHGQQSRETRFHFTIGYGF